MTGNLQILTSLHTVRIAESREPASVDYTGQICQFSEIGRSGPHTVLPHPWACYTASSNAQWHIPNGTVVPVRPKGSHKLMVVSYTRQLLAVAWLLLVDQTTTHQMGSTVV